MQRISYLADDHESRMETIATLPESGQLHEIFSHKINLHGNWLVATQVGEIIWDPNATLEDILRERP